VTPYVGIPEGSPVGDLGGSLLLNENDPTA
jgi:hypothetical protein